MRRPLLLLPMFLLLTPGSLRAQPDRPPSPATPASGPIDTRGSSLPTNANSVPTPLGTAVPTPPPTPAVFVPVTGGPRAAPAATTPSPARRRSRAVPCLVIGVSLAVLFGLVVLLRRRRH